MWHGVRGALRMRISAPVGASASQPLRSARASLDGPTAQVRRELRVACWPRPVGRMPCHAPPEPFRRKLPRETPSRGACRGTHDCVACTGCCRVMPANWPLEHPITRKSGARWGPRPARSPEVPNLHASPPLPRTVASRAGCRCSARLPLASPRVRRLARAKRSGHQRSRWRHIARARDGAQGQSGAELCRNCDCRRFVVEEVGNRRRNSAPFRKTPG